MPVGIGIDPSSKTLALVAKYNEHGKPIVHKFQLTRRKSDRGGLPDSCNRAGLLVRTFVYCCRYTYGETSVFVEEPLSYGHGGNRVNATIPLAKIVGAVLSAAVEAGASNVETIHQATWKKESLGKGNLSKEGVTERLSCVWPSAFRACREDQDLYDAAGIAITAFRDAVSRTKS